MSRRRALQGLVLLGVAIVGIAVTLWATTPTYDLSQDNLLNITFEMDEAAVIRIVGGRPTFNGFTPIRRRNVMVKGIILRADGSGLSFCSHHVDFDESKVVTWREWATDSKSLALGFDQHGKIEVMIHLDYSETFWGSLRRQLRIP